MRRIELLPVLQDALATHKAGVKASPSDRVFPTQTGAQLNPENFRKRVMEKAVEHANKRLVAQDSVPLPEGLTPHKLRHTFASVLVALGTDPGDVMDQIGHSDAGFTLRVYRHGMRRDVDSKQRLRALVGADGASKRHQKGTSSDIAPPGDAIAAGDLIAETAS
jgi:integrase